MSRHIHVHVHTADRSAWEEGKHPRAPDGKFGSGAGSTEGRIKLNAGVWHGADGLPLGPGDQKRVKDLGIPPAWTDVRLNPDPTAKLQAVGKDAKGRSQRLYSAAHSEAASAEKFARLRDFNAVAPKVRGKAESDMADAKAKPKTRDAAAITALIAATGFRPGSDDDTGADKKAHGASNLEGKHVKVEGDVLSFEFTGKKGVTIKKELKHPALASYISERKARAGDGPLFTANDADVRDYFHGIAGKDFKVKDFRTWNGTATALAEVAKMPAPKTKADFQKARLAVGKIVAAHLGNTPTVALASYISPQVFSTWELPA
jgi:DNA topoisomerase-1